MNNRLIAVFLIGLISCFAGFAVLSNAQEVEKEIARNQAEQVNLELEITSNELMNADLNAEREYLEEQAQAQKDAEMAQQQIDDEVEAFLEQANQEAVQIREAMEQEEQSYLDQSLQESEQQAAEIEEMEQRIKSDLSDQE